MKNVKKALNQREILIEEEPLKSLTEGFNNTKSLGGTTALIGTLNYEQNSLTVATVGDSCYLHFREKVDGTIKLVGRSEPQEISFNFPYQLTRLPNFIELKTLK